MEGCILIESKLDPDCGCTEEEWDTHVGYCSFHFNPAGFADGHFDNGTAEWELKIEGEDIGEFYKNLSSYMDSLPPSDE